MNVDRTIEEIQRLELDSFNWRGNLLNKDIMVRGLPSQRHCSNPQSATTSELVSTYYGRSQTADYDPGQENDYNSRYGREEEGIQIPARNLPDGV